MADELGARLGAGLWSRRTTAAAGTAEAEIPRDAGIAPAKGLALSRRRWTGSSGQIRVRTGDIIDS